MAEQLVAPAATQLSSRVWTVPNILSMLRLAGVPLFLYWALVAEDDGRAILLLMAAGASDYFDGMIARRWHSFTRLGQLLDPLADRLYILATLLALVARDGLPLWWALLLIARDAALTPTIPFLRRHGYGPLPVHFLGKAATFSLLYAFPMLLAALPSNDDLLATVFRPLGLGVRRLGERAVPLVGRPLRRAGPPAGARRARRDARWARPCAHHCSRPAPGCAGRPASRAGAAVPSAAHRRDRHAARRDGDRRPMSAAAARPVGPDSAREGRRHGGRRGHPPAADDREPAQAAAAGREPPDHGARAAAAEAARLRRDRRDGPVPRQPRPHLLR